MTKPLRRDDLIGLLERLDSDRDEEVLEAARELQARIVDAGLTWEDLLVPEEAAGAVDDAEDQGPEPAKAPAEKTGRTTETLALIGKMLARPGISEDFREELEGYKQDIAESAFDDRDHDYVRALYKRLSTRR
jgi:hypothetical protein